MDIALVAIGDDPLGQLQDVKLEIICDPLISRTSITPLIHKQKKLPLKDNGIFVYGELYYDWDQDQSNVGAAAYLLPILKPPSKPTLFKTGITLYGLMVTKAEGRNKGYFTHVGAFNLTFTVQNYLELMNHTLQRT